MPIFNITTENSLGFSHSGEVMAYGDGTIELTDEEVQLMIALIREHGGSDDVEVLGLEGEHPELYKKLDDACREIAHEAEYEHWVLEGYENGYCDVDLDEVMDMCEREYGFHFEYDPKDFIDEDLLEEAEENGDLEEFVDEDALYDAKVEAFYNWVEAYGETMGRKDRVLFLAETFQLEPDLCGLDYPVVIPNSIVEMAKMG